ncbi:MAG TPA: hypothetical protein EYH21_00405 [Methanothermococcus okinawensis]|uniref:Uncharacterized protein n=1 Tax=Methanothermococcus okinawensis TaxID=155863 RepID=A0A832ZJ18_9EURY|nr:hypothetical protein [Methanothermococcus okinawensis]
MIFDNDILFGIIILIVGMGFFTLSMVEHTDSYADAVKTSILYDKASDQLKSIVSDGTVESAILLINNGYESKVEEVLKNRIDLKNYRIVIGDYTISQGDLNDKDIVVVSTVIVLNRTEGWYGVYGNEKTLRLTDRCFLSEEEVYSYLGGNSHSFVRAIYYFKSSTPINVSLICGG